MTAVGRTDVAGQAEPGRVEAERQAHKPGRWSTGMASGRLNAPRDRRLLQVEVEVAERAGHDEPVRAGVVGVAEMDPAGHSDASRGWVMAIAGEPPPSRPPRPA